jgi:hypothetical protein
METEAIAAPKKRFFSRAPGKLSLWVANTVFGAVLGTLAYSWAQPLLAWMNLDKSEDQVKASMSRLDELVAMAKSSSEFDQKFLAELQAVADQTRNSVEALKQNVSVIREGNIERKGYDMAADFYLREGQGARIGNGDETLGLLDISKSGNTATIRLNSKREFVNVGQKLTFMSGNDECYLAFIGASAERQLAGFVSKCGV